MCLTLIAALALTQSSSVTLDEITMGGSALDRQQNPVQECKVTDISADGKLVVGQGTPVPNSTYRGFTWDETNKVLALPAPKELQNNYPGIMACAISDDGKVIGGRGLWLRPGAKIAKYFKSQSVSASVLGNLVPTETTITAINQDGSAMGVEVFGSTIKLFVWRAGKGLKPLLDAKGNRFEGAITDISGDGNVVSGVTRRGENQLGFVVSNSRFLACPALKGYTGSIVKAVSPDGKLAFGNYSHPEGYQEAGFVWKIGKSKPELLPQNFIVESVSNDGSVIAGWVDGDPALLLGKRVLKMNELLKERLTPGEIRDIKLVAVKTTASYIYVLADTPSDTTDYRIKINWPLDRRLPPRSQRPQTGRPERMQSYVSPTNPRRSPASPHSR